MNWDLIFKELSEASIYAVLMVLAFVMFYAMHKYGIKQIKELSENATKTIRESYADLFDKLTRHLEHHRE